MAADEWLHNQHEKIREVSRKHYIERTMLQLLEQAGSCKLADSTHQAIRDLFRDLCLSYIPTLQFEDKSVVEDAEEITKAWEEVFGKLDDPDVQRRMDAYFNQVFNSGN